MHLQLLAFAHAHDQLGFRERLVECSPTETPRQLLARLAPAAACGTMRVALDQEYADWDAPIGQARELAFIPPVSGG
jgi:molybdopterin synthase sulfur carrier subunit